MGPKQYIVFRARKYFAGTMRFNYSIGTNSMRLTPTKNSYFIVGTEDFIRHEGN
jgi:hypothetical protein